MKALLLTLGLCILTVSPCLAQLADFKGVPFGVSEKEFLAKLPQYVCRAANPNLADRVCAISGDSFAGQSAFQITAFFIDDKFGSVLAEIPSVGYTSAAEAVTAKFGQPQSDRSFGTFRRTHWISTGLNIFGDSNGGISNHATFVLTSDSHVLAFKQRKEAKAARDKKDL